jgi:hypothetical protein
VGRHGRVFVVVREGVWLLWKRRWRRMGYAVLLARRVVLVLESRSMVVV